MKITIPCGQVHTIIHEPGQSLALELSMSESQMLATLREFLSHGISDETWTAWQAQINLEIYGATA